jgi:hypothetical protein
VVVADLHTPKDVLHAIEKCRIDKQIPTHLESRTLAPGHLRLQDKVAMEENRLRRQLSKCYSVQEIDAVKADLEEVFGPNVETAVREELQVSRLRRTQFLELELETRWSRPFAGPLPPHSRAARRYEQELGRSHPKVIGFVEEERRYVSARGGPRDAAVGNAGADARTPRQARPGTRQVHYRGHR